MYHLREGDPEPEVNPDKFTLYDLKFCPFCQRVRYTLDYHHIPYDRIFINPISKPSWYLRMHPEGKVPLLRFRGERLIESDLVMRFVDQFNGKPETSLLTVCGEEAFRNALALSNELLRPRYRISYCDDASSADVDKFLAACSKIEDTIKGPYLCGDRVSLADMALAPFLNAWHFTIQRLTSLKPDTTEKSVSTAFPKLNQYRELMCSQPYVIATAYEEGDYVKFVQLFRTKDATGERKPSWAVLVATKSPQSLGFCSLRPWPRVDEPNVYRQHVWGCRLDDENSDSPQYPSILVLAYSPVASMGQINCTGVPFILPGIEAGVQSKISCLMPGCKHASISSFVAKSVNWPFCTVDGSFDSPFYPSTKSSTTSSLWISFDAISLLPGLISGSYDGDLALRDRIGALPFQLVKSLSQPPSPPSVPHRTNTPPLHTLSPLVLWDHIKSGLTGVFRYSYTLHLLGRYFTSCKTGPPPLIVLSFALQLILFLLLVVVFHFSTFSPNSQRFCHVYSQSLRLLTLLSQSLRSSNSTFHGSCPALGPLTKSPWICSALEGPSQQTPTDIFNLFTIVSFEAIRQGCIFETVASSTDYFALELNRLLTWLGSSEPAGWKINRNLALLMSRFFISHVAAWRAYVHFLIYTSSHISQWIYHVLSVNLRVEPLYLFIFLFSGVFLEVYLNRIRWKTNFMDLSSSSIRLAFALIICFCLDLILLGSLHLSCFYVYTVRFQLLAVAASWRLCRSGSKWNPLRNRVDTIPQNDDFPPIVPSAVLVPPGIKEEEEENNDTLSPSSSQSRHLDRVFVATFLGVATGLCLLPTTAAFYAVFSVIYIALVFVKAILTRIVYGILSFPIGAVVSWCLNRPSTRTTLIVKTPVLDSVHVPFLSMELVRGNIGSVLERNSLFDTKDLFGKRCSVGMILRSLVCANLLYPLSGRD